MQTTECSFDFARVGKTVDTDFFLIISIPAIRSVMRDVDNGVVDLSSERFKILPARYTDIYDQRNRRGENVQTFM